MIKIKRDEKINSWQMSQRITPEFADTRRNTTPSPARGIGFMNKEQPWFKMARNGLKSIITGVTTLQ